MSSHVSEPAVRQTVRINAPCISRMETEFEYEARTGYTADAWRAYQRESPACQHGGGPFYFMMFGETSEEYVKRIY